MTARTFWVKCDGARHRVVLGEHGVSFPEHVDNVYRHAEAGEALAVLAAIPEEPAGCYRVARLVQQWHQLGYVGVQAHKLNNDERRLFAALRGRMLGRQALRR